MTESDAAAPGRSVWRIRSGTLVALAGAMACTVGCTALSVLAATFSAASIGFVRIGLLRNGLAVLSIAFVLRGVWRARVRTPVTRGGEGRSSA
jgi:hypothetical protein